MPKGKPYLSLRERSSFEIKISVEDRAAEKI
jgi:hypothetical protein